MIGQSLRGLGAFFAGALLLFAVVAAMSRLLQMKEIPDYIRNISKGIANLFRGAFGI
jgi:hypothetical protein